MIFCEGTPTLLTVTLIPHQSNWYRNLILMLIRVKQPVNFTGYSLKRRTLLPLARSLDSEPYKFSIRLIGILQTYKMCKRPECIRLVLIVIGKCLVSL